MTPLSMQIDHRGAKSRTRSGSLHSDLVNAGRVALRIVEQVWSDEVGQNEQVVHGWTGVEVKFTLVAGPARTDPRHAHDRSGSVRRSVDVSGSAYWIEGKHELLFAW